MLLAVHNLLARELDRMDAAPPIIHEDMHYMRALSALCDVLRDIEGPVVLMPIPGFTIQPEDGGYVVYGWNHRLLTNGGKVHPQIEVSWHHYRWAAGRAANAWVKRAQAVSQRIAAEVHSSLRAEVER